ncbi:hypothetical protein HMPREF0373_00128 [Eubacterium ramulus ATCC 29099]|uniref:Uncharacterized protein n=1 Tax=Eubacterium ramulus ATCC 29099 TaxID=1256908 RepID=U2PPU7_EUBRA|nr:hypothetical protein HMPREF0373_00128 [Eubacterium ramulus ATCC 29099]
MRSSCIRVGAFLVIKKIIDDYKLQEKCIYRKQSLPIMKL